MEPKIYSYEEYLIEYPNHPVFSTDEDNVPYYFDDIVRITEDFPERFRSFNGATFYNQRILTAEDILAHLTERRAKEPSVAPLSPEALSDLEELCDEWNINHEVNVYIPNRHVLVYTVGKATFENK